MLIPNVEVVICFFFVMAKSIYVSVADLNWLDMVSCVVRGHVKRAVMP